jgi:hypothetical protein
MKSKAKGPLTVDGIALGQTRAEVEAMLGRGTTNANPAWARYYGEEAAWPPGRPTLPVLVSFRPAWPEREAGGWRVQSLCGSVLRQGETTLVSVGDLASGALALLGPPDEEFQTEPGFRCLAFAGCLLTYDEHSGKVVEIGLRFPSRLARLSNHPPAPTLLDGALAC